MLKKDILAFAGIFMFFAFGEIFTLLSYLGLNINFLIKYNIVAVIKYFIFFVIFIKVLNKVKAVYILGILLYGIALLLSCLVNAENIVYAQEMIFTFAFSIFPLIIVFLYINDPGKILRYILYASYIAIAKTWLVPFLDIYMDTVNYGHL